MSTDPSTFPIMSSSQSPRERHENEGNALPIMIGSVHPADLHSAALNNESASYERYLHEKRRSFRMRGSLGPTISSAPSVEHEGYRTPRPSVTCIKGGKSFDSGGTASTNALFQVTVPQRAYFL
ncbi:hypothetical protein AB6A40_007117 [Gnathostoma spinigerum]|uniref:Uncharacterized protein n=1 Tax=Gnathostoma spinigerum TaxID=75299 RepID=A0ABD6EK99_9BILA